MDKLDISDDNMLLINAKQIKALTIQEKLIDLQGNENNMINNVSGVYIK